VVTNKNSRRAAFSVLRPQGGMKISGGRKKWDLRVKSKNNRSRYKIALFVATPKISEQVSQPWKRQAYRLNSYKERQFLVTLASFD
jgi:hypothetical protein